MLPSIDLRSTIGPAIAKFLFAIATVLAILYCLFRTTRTWS